MSPEEEGEALHQLLPVRRLLLLGLVVWRLLRLAGRLAPLALPLLAEGVAAGADVADVVGLLLERLLRLERPLPVLRLPAWAVEAAERQRLRHRACWARSSWWPTREVCLLFEFFSADVDACINNDLFCDGCAEVTCPAAGQSRRVAAET